GDKIRSQSKPFLYLFQLVAAKDPVHEQALTPRPRTLPVSPPCSVHHFQHTMPHLARLNMGVFRSGKIAINNI
ncbi:hypothetical protein ACV1DR_21665, partial [Aeromonas jandaei]